MAARIRERRLRWRSGAPRRTTGHRGVAAIACELGIGRCGSSHDPRLAELTAAEPPLTVGRPKAAPRHRADPTHYCPWPITQRMTDLSWNLNFAHAAERVSDRHSSRSRVAGFELGALPAGVLNAAEIPNGGALRFARNSVAYNYRRGPATRLRVRRKGVGRTAPSRASNHTACMRSRQRSRSDDCGPATPKTRRGPSHRIADSPTC